MISFNWETQKELPERIKIKTDLNPNGETFIHESVIKKLIGKMGE